jgi:glyoxylate reductase
MASRPKVFMAVALPAAGLELLSARFDVRTGLEHAPGASAIVAGPSVAVGADLLDTAGSSLAVVANFGVGYDNIDIAAARERGVQVTNTPDVLTNATAELAVALMLAAGRRIAEADALVRSGGWRGLGPEELLGRELSGATVGLIGFGRIGRRVAELVRGFDVRILYSARHDAPVSLGAERRELADVLAHSDFVSVHVALTAQTRHLVGADELGRMAPGAVFVNTSRGGVVDTSALVQGLRAGRPAAAGLDVYEDEPHVPAELRELPNTVLLPHVGSATASTRDAMARLCAENVIAVIEGREPPTAVA